MAPRGVRALETRLGEERCPVPLTGAVVRLSEAEGVMANGGHLEDVCVALVVDGSYPAAAEAVDLGSGRRRTVDLNGPAVILGWVTPQRVQSLQSALEARVAEAADGASVREGLAGFSLIQSLLRRRGVDAFTLPVVLRLGFADVCRDLDPHDHPAVRFRLADGGVARAQLDVSHAALRVSMNPSQDLTTLHEGLEAAFPQRTVTRGSSDALTGFGVLRVQLPVPADLTEVRDRVAELREGLLRLLARFDPERHATLQGVLATFGPRDRLRMLDRTGARGGEAEPAAGTPGRRVH